MDGVVYLHDGSFEGLLNAVALAVKDNRPVTAIAEQKDYVPRLFDTIVVAQSDPDQAERLLNYLARLGSRAAALAVNGYLGEDKDVGMHLYNFVLLCLTQGINSVNFHSDSSVRYLDDLCRRVSFEAHRLNGLIRFRILAGGLQYAPFRSDHKVIGYCANHFRQRLTTRSWILHDIGREIALFWDQETLQPVSVDRELTDYVALNGELPASYLTDAEQYYQELWRGFHTTVSLGDRKNQALQRQFLPRRYWQYLVEIPG